MTERKPWEVAGTPWKTESAFWSWVRGVLRKGWSRHPVKVEYIKAQRRKIINPNPKTSKRFPEVWGVTCECCKEEVLQSNSEVDHLNQSGSLRGISDIQGFVERMFLVDFSVLRIVCKPCHKIISHAQNEGLTFEEAKLDKQVIEIMKWPKKEIADYCNKHGYTDVSNDVKRRAAVTAILKGE